MGQPSNYVSNRVGIFMYWENSWLNVQNFQNFQVKTYFIQKLIQAFLTDRIFNFFTFALNNVKQTSYMQLSKFYTSKTTTVNSHTNRFTTINLSKLWIIKYQNFLIFQIFGFFLKQKTNKFKVLNKKVNFQLIFNLRRFKKLKKLERF